MLRTSRTLDRRLGEHDRRYFACRLRRFRRFVNQICDAVSHHRSALPLPAGAKSENRLRVAPGRIDKSGGNAESLGFYVKEVKFGRARPALLQELALGIDEDELATESPGFGGSTAVCR